MEVKHTKQYIFTAEEIKKKLDIPADEKITSVSKELLGKKIKVKTEKVIT